MATTDGKVTLIEEGDIRAVDFSDGSAYVSISVDDEGYFSITHIDKHGDQTDFAMPQGELLDKALSWVGLQRSDNETDPIITTATVTVEP